MTPPVITSQLLDKRLLQYNGALFVVVILFALSGGFDIPELLKFTPLLLLHLLTQVALRKLKTPSPQVLRVTLGYFLCFFLFLFLKCVIGLFAITEFLILSLILIVAYLGYLWTEHKKHKQGHAPLPHPSSDDPTALALYHLQNGDLDAYFEVLEPIVPANLKPLFSEHKGKFMADKSAWNFHQQLRLFVKEVEQAIQSS
ncbi:MAG: hypothetical protein ACPGJS_19010 [Flammeovirgaceae bacterium]